MTAMFTGLGAGLGQSSANILGGAGQLGVGSQGRAGENVLVNAATGNLLITRQDEWLVGRGPDIGISRTYNSLGQVSDGDNGDQWQQSTARRVYGLTGTQDTAGSTIKRLSGDGSVITYTWNATRLVYQTTDGDGAHDILKKVGANWIWTDGSSQLTETYAAYGTGSWRIIEQADSDANKLIFTYVGAQLDKVTTAGGEWVQYSWSGNNITQITVGYTDQATSIAKTQVRTRYAYDASNRLIKVTTDLSPQDNVITDGKVYEVNYTYYGTSKQIASIAQTDGSNLAVAYDASGRATSLTQTVAIGDTRVTSLTYGTGFTTITGPDGQVTRLDYDTKRQLTKITAPAAVAGSSAQTVQFAYDASGNVTSITDANGLVTRHTYDARGNLLNTTDPNANVVTRVYDTNNNKIAETVTGADANGAATAHTTRYVYDLKNHLRYAVSAEGYVTEYRYTSFGELQYTIAYPEHSYAIGSGTLNETQLNAWLAGIANKSAAQLTAYTYDGRGNQIATLAYGAADAAGNGVTAEGYSRTWFTYDQSGQLLNRINEGETASESFIYDGLGRLIGSTDLHGGTTTIVFNDGATNTLITTASGQVTSSTYNKAGELIGQITSGGFDGPAASSYKYDKLGRLRQATNAIGGNSYYLYDKAGRKTGEINHYGWLVEYQYDRNNRIIGEGRYVNSLSAAQIAALADPNNALDIAAIRPAPLWIDSWSWTVYDNAGRVSQTIDGSGAVTSFEYDKSDRLVKTTGYFNKLSQAQVDGFKTTPPAALVTPAADAVKDSISRTFYDGDGRIIGSLDGEGYLTETVYDKAGRKVEEVAYAAKTSANLWAAGSFVQLRASAAPTSAANIRSRYVYDGQGQLRYSINAQGGVSGFAYNNAGKLTTTTQYAVPIATTNYSYNNVKALVTAITNPGNDRISTIAYNGRGQIATTIDAAGLVTSFTYDNRGQVIRTVVGSGADARVTRNYYTSSGDLRYSVDAEGYVTRFDYDALRRVISETGWTNKVTVSDSTTIDQLYVLPRPC